MLYAREVIELLEPYPGRCFRMKAIINYVRGGRQIDRTARAAMNVQIYRVIRQLEEIGSVVTERGNGHPCYKWAEKT